MITDDELRRKKDVEDIEKRITRVVNSGSDDVWDLCVLAQLSPRDIQEMVAEDNSDEFTDSAIDFLIKYRFQVNNFIYQLNAYDPCADTLMQRDMYWSLPIMPRQAFKALQN